MSKKLSQYRVKPRDLVASARQNRALYSFGWVKWKMRRQHFHLLSVLLLSFTPAHAAVPILSPHAYGDVQFGAKLEDAERKLKQHASPRKREPACDYVSFPKYPNVKFMVEDGVVTRADVGSQIRNSAGIVIGMPLAQARRLHPAITMTPHKYDDEGHYLILSTPDGRAALVFETDRDKVVHARGGLQPSVGYVEGCL